MAKLKLIANPTFEVAVPIPVHGGESVPVKFTFKHRTKTALKEWQESLRGKQDADVILEMVEAWEFDDELNRDNVEQLLDNYAGATMAILTTYLQEISQARVKN